MSDIGGKKICLGSNYDRKVGYIEGLMANILFKLPVKHLLKCKTVAKLWKALIGEHYFAKMHFSNSRKNPKLIAYVYRDNPDPVSNLYMIEENGRNMPFVRFPGFVHDYPTFEVVCSFNGLICCTDIQEEELIIRICNPFTQEFHILPSGSPSVVNPIIAVVFDPENHKYKVLRFFLDNHESEDDIYQCESYVPGTDVWKRIGNVPCPVSTAVYPAFPPCVNVGERMYWLVWLKHGDWVPTYILSVDMDDNFVRVELPEPILEEFNVFTYLVELENRLILIGVDDTEDYFLIWTLQDHDQSSWSYLGPVAHRMPEFGIDAIAAITALQDELLFVIKPNSGVRFRYRLLNLERMSWRNLRVSPKLKRDYPTVFPFTESLFKSTVTD